MISRGSFARSTAAAAITLALSPLAARADAPGTIVDVAAAAPQFSTLVAAVKAAGLADTLSGPGPFTVFAPTNDAFAKLRAGTLDSLLKPENQAKLKAILLYHVVGFTLKSSDLQDSDVVTADNKTLHIDASGKPVKINNATITKTDILASNGIIQVVDTVLIPPTN